MKANFWSSKSARILALGLVTTLLACDSPTSPTTPRATAGVAQYHIAGAGIQTMIIEVAAPTVTADDPVLVTAQLFVVGLGKDGTHPVGGQRLSLTINGMTYDQVTVRLGHAYFALPPFPAGTYPIAVEFRGDKHYSRAYTPATLTVTP
jgi:hypothetical protein